MLVEVVGHEVAAVALRPEAASTAQIRRASGAAVRAARRSPPPPSRYPRPLRPPSRHAVPSSLARGGAMQPWRRRTAAHQPRTSSAPRYRCSARRERKEYRGRRRALPWSTARHGTVNSSLSATRVRGTGRWRRRPRFPCASPSPPGETYEFRLHGVGIDAARDVNVTLRDASGSPRSVSTTTPAAATWGDASGARLAAPLHRVGDRRELFRRRRRRRGRGLPR